MHVPRDVNQVRSHRNTSVASSGLGKVTHARGNPRSTSGIHPAYASECEDGAMRMGVLDIGPNPGPLVGVDAYRGAPPVPAHSFKETLRLSEHLDGSGAVS